MFNHISILRTFNVGNLNDSLINELKNANLNNIKIHIGEYNSLADSSIEFKSKYNNLPITFILTTLEDLIKLSGGSLLSFEKSLKKIISFLDYQLPIICKYSKDVFIIEPISVLEGNSFSNNICSTELKAYLNSYFINLQKKYSNLKFYALPNQLLMSRDARYYFYGSLPLGVKTGNLISNLIINIILRYIRSKPKIIVFDLDNTIWGGVIGEDGIDGIQIGNSCPGNVYKNIQSSLLRFHKYGVLLIAISKNTIENAELGLNHDEGIIKKEHLLALSASWDSKPASLLKILKENNLSQNGIYFLDDSEIEREEMSMANIDIKILNQNSSPIHLLESLLDLESNIHHSLTSDDFIRTRSYLSLKKANEKKSNFSNKEDFLKSLKLKLIIKSLKPINLKRAHQLITKTNQFNLTSERLTFSDLESRMNSKNYKYIMFSLEDIYTNHGEIGLIGLSFKKNDIEIVHFLLSCRVLGRGIEYSMFNYIIDQTRCFPFKNLSSYYSINKNSEPASNFYSDVGMKIVKKTKQRIDFNANIPSYDIRKIKWIEQKEIL